MTIMVIYKRLSSEMAVLCDEGSFTPRQLSNMAQGLSANGDLVHQPTDDVARERRTDDVRTAGVQHPSGRRTHPETSCGDVVATGTRTSRSMEQGLSTSVNNANKYRNNVNNEGYKIVGVTENCKPVSVPQSDDIASL